MNGYDCFMGTLCQFADKDAFDEVLGFEFIDGFGVGGFVEAYGEDGAVLIADAAHAHGAYVELVFATDGADGADDAGSVVVEDDQDGAFGRHFQFVVIHPDDTGDFFADDGAGDGAFDFIGYDFSGHNAGKIFGLGIFDLIDA